MIRIINQLEHFALWWLFFTIFSFLFTSKFFCIGGCSSTVATAFSSSTTTSLSVPYRMALATRRQTRQSLASKPDDEKVQSTIKTITKKTQKDHDVSTPTSPSKEFSHLLNDWIGHSDASFHHFSQDEAIEIRLALLSWYRANRRKLPWRGDPPPYDGSTAGINSAPSSQKNKKATPDVKQPNITSFFKKQTVPKAESVKSSSLVEETKNTKNSSSGEEHLGKIPVSGYGVWVSEIMLQQTRVEAVIPYWIKWMNSFPTVHDLAKASEDQVNSHWAGLGFYRRARLLHQGAKHVVDTYDGNLPQTVPELLKITGIGPYTASAIASIAFDVCVPVVDGNVCRVLSRLTGIANHIKAPILKDKLGWDLAKQLVEAGDGKNAGEVNQALMELGATYCAPSGTGIDERDPLKGFYLSTKLSRAYHYMKLNGQSTIGMKSMIKDDCPCELCSPNGIEVALESFQEKITDNLKAEEAAAMGHAIFPLDPPKSKKREEDIVIAAIANTDDEGDTWWLLVKRPSEGLLAGQWEFPSVCVATRDATAKPALPGKQKRRKAMDSYLRELFEEDIDEMIANVRTRTDVIGAPLEHIFSHIKHYMWVEICETSTNLKLLEWSTVKKKEIRWMREKDMKEVGITSGVKKILKSVKAQCQTGDKSSSRKRKR